MPRRALLAAALLLCTLLLTSCGFSVAGTPQAATPVSDAVMPLSTASPPTSPLLPPTRTPLADLGLGTAPISQLEVVEKGFSSYAIQFSGQKLSYAVLLRNANTTAVRAQSATVRVTFTDAAGAVVLTGDDLVLTDLGPGQTTAIGGTDLGKATGIPATMTAEVLKTRWSSAANGVPGEITTGPATVRPGPYSANSLLVDCTATSTFASKVVVRTMTVVLRDAQGKIIGGFGTYDDAEGKRLGVPGNGTTAFTLRAWQTPPQVPSAACYPNHNRGI